MGYSIIAQNLSFGLKLTALLLLLSCTLLTSSGPHDTMRMQMLWKKPILGSKPPKCVNKCFNCNPCLAVLVAPSNHKAVTEEDESYYLLSWRCKCGNKYYQP